MSARRARTSGLSSTDQDAARLRLTTRFASHQTYALSAVEALGQVSTAVSPVHTPELPEVTAEDVLDALALAGPALFHLEVSELEVMAYARHVLGLEWEQIGRSLGYAAGAEKQGAQARYARLAGRYPWVPEEIKKAKHGDQEGGQQQ